VYTYTILHDEDATLSSCKPQMDKIKTLKSITNGKCISDGVYLCLRGAMKECQQNPHLVLESLVYQKLYSGKHRGSNGYMCEVSVCTEHTLCTGSHLFQSEGLSL